MRKKIIKFEWKPVSPLAGTKPLTIDEYLDSGWTYQQLIDQGHLVRCK